MWPTPQDYNEAVQNPALAFADPDLQKTTATVTALGLPRPISGTFASVYHMEGQGQQIAVRCFLHQVLDQGQRYEKIDACLSKARLPYMASFVYLPQGIKVGQEIYPILKMEWVDGMPLIEWVQSELQNAASLEIILKGLLEISSSLRAHGIAHGDLQHGNILIQKNRIRLVDYDGMFVPELYNFSSMELGHRHYQHPRRNKEHFGGYLDNFSLWSIYTSLYCLSQDSRLWSRLEAGDECLLFRQSDYENPQESPAFRHLEHHDSHVIRQASKSLRALLSIRPEDIPPLGEPISSVDHLEELSKAELWYSTAFPDSTALNKLRAGSNPQIKTGEMPLPLKLLKDEEDDEETPWFQSPAASANPQSRMPPDYHRIAIRRPVHSTAANAATTTNSSAQPLQKRKSKLPINITHIIAFATMVALAKFAFTSFTQSTTKASLAPYLISDNLPQLTNAGAQAYREGQAAFSRKEFTNAIKHFTAALSQLPSQYKPLCNYQIGKCNLALGNNTSALADFQTASSALEKQNVIIPSLEFHRGQAFLYLRRFDEAANTFRLQLGQCSLYELGDQYRLPALKGLHDAALGQLLAAHKEGLDSYKQYTRDAKPPVQAIYSDLQQIARTLENEKKFDFAYRIWQTALEQIDMRPFAKAAATENYSFKIQVLQAMLQNREHTRDLKKIAELEKEIKELSKSRRLNNETVLGQDLRPAPARASSAPNTHRKLTPALRPSSSDAEDAMSR